MIVILLRILRQRLAVHDGMTTKAGIRSGSRVVPAFLLASVLVVADDGALVRVSQLPDQEFVLARGRGRLDAEDHLPPPRPEPLVPARLRDADIPPQVQEASLVPRPGVPAPSLVGSLSARAPEHGSLPWQLSSRRDDGPALFANFRRRAARRARPQMRNSETLIGDRIGIRKTCLSPIPIPTPSLKNYESQRNIFRQRPANLLRDGRRHGHAVDGKFDLERGDTSHRRRVGSQVRHQPLIIRLIRSARQISREIFQRRGSARSRPTRCAASGASASQ